MSKRVANILAVVGVFIVFGAIGYDDTMIFAGKFYSLSETIKHMMIGFLFFIPRVVYGKKFT